MWKPDSCDFCSLEAGLRVSNALTLIFVKFQTIKPDEPYYSTYDEIKGATRTAKRKGSEPAIVDYVAIDGKKHLQKVSGQPFMLEIEFCKLVFYKSPARIKG